MNRLEIIGNATLYLGDCMEVLPQLQGVHAVVTDPPYGIGFKWKDSRRIGRKSGLAWGQSSSSSDYQRPWEDIVGDREQFDPSPWLQFPQVILWGANNYGALPPARRWLVWDKRRDGTPDDHGDAELAWTNLKGVIRVHRQVWRGLVREGEENAVNGPKVHPTQKPVALMKWCIDMTTGIILDPFMGSGATGIAAIQRGRKFFGVEVEPKYFDIACRRIDEASRQADLFIKSPEDAIAAAMPELLL